MKRSPIVVAIIVLSLSLSGAAISQQPQGASVQGIVVRFGTNEPIPGAVVELRKPAGPNASSPQNKATTGGDGRFVFTDVPRGEYQLSATHPNGSYTRAEYLQRDPRGRGIALALADGQSVRDVRLGMAATGSISGRVIDRDGDPVGNARVLALELVYQEGRRVMNIVQALRTDERGEYRLFWLPPGRYYVGVQPDDPRSAFFTTFVAAGDVSIFRDDGSTPVVTRRTSDSGELLEETAVLAYYGGGRDVQQARPIDVLSGANVAAVDISLADTRVRVHHVRGIVTNAATGEPVASAVLRLIPRTPSPHSLIANTISDTAGVFDIAGAMPGSYFLFAVSGGQSYGGRGPGGTNGPGLNAAKGMTARTVIEIGNSDLENIQLAVKQGYNIPGRVTIEGGNTDVTRLSLYLPRDPDLLGLPDAQTARPSADGTFSIQGIAPGEYRVNVLSLPASAYVKSIRLGTVDLVANGLRFDAQPEGQLEVLVSMAGGTLEGVAADDRPEPASNITVVLVPAVAGRNQPSLYKVAATDPTGRFKLEGIVPGDYKIFAWEYVADGFWQDADFLRPYETRGVTVRVTEGSRESVQVRVIR